MKVRIGDICTLKSGTSLKDDVLNANEGIPYIKVSDMNLEGNEKYIIKANSYANESISPKMLFPIGTILFPKRGGAIGTNKKRIANKVVCADLNTMGVIPSEKVRPLFLYYYFQNIDFGTLYNGSSVPQINNTDIAPMEIELLSLQEQDEAIAVLEKVDNIISGRKRELERLDALIKARFVEMFGDSVVNPMKWEEMNISRVVGGKISNGFFAKRDDYCEDGNVSVLGVANVVNRMYSNYTGLPKTNGTEIDIKKFAVKYGDLLFCRSSLVAEGIGKASVVPRCVPDNTLFECHVIRLPLDLKMVVPEYLQVLSTMDYFRNQIIAQSKTATMTTIGQDGILKCNILLPPLELQKEFLTFIEQVDKSKVKEIKKNYEPIDNGFYYKNIWKGL